MNALIDTVDTTKELPENPHCEPQWPETEPNCDYLLIDLQRSLYGASVLAKLINADSNIATSRRDSDEPEKLPSPFNEYVISGLLAALETCIYKSIGCAENVRDRLQMQSD